MLKVTEDTAERYLQNFRCQVSYDLRVGVHSQKSNA